MAKSKKSKRRLLVFGPLAIVAVVYFFVTFITYIVNYSALKMEESSLNKQLVTLQEQKANLKIEIVKLNNPEYVARYAKENYLYSGNGEYVIKIDKSTSTTTDSSSKKNYTNYIIIGVVVIFFLSLIVNRKKKKIVQKWTII